MRSRSRGNGGIIGRDNSFLGYRGVQTLTDYNMQDGSLSPRGAWEYETFDNLPELEYVVGLLPGMTNGDQKFAGVLRISEGFSGGGFSSSNLASFGISGAYVVDWGDGTTSSYASGATAYHSYAYNDVTGVTSPHTGFKYVVVQAEVNAGDTFQRFVVDDSLYPHPDQQYSTFNLVACRFAGQELEKINVANGTYSASHQGKCRGMSYIDLVGSNNHVATLDSSGHLSSTKGLLLHRDNMLVIDGSEFFETRPTGQISSLFNWTGFYGTPGFRAGMVDKNSTKVFTSTFGGGEYLYQLYNTRNSETITEDGTDMVGKYTHTGKYIKRLEIPAGITNARFMFSHNKNLECIEELIGLDVEDAQDMFEESVVQRVGSVYLPNCTNASNLFYRARLLEEIGSLTLNSSGVSCGNMFYECGSLRKVGSLDFNPGRASQMFFGCKRLETIPNIDLSECIQISGIFQNCISLKSIPDAFYTTGITHNYATFSNTPSLEFTRGFSFGDFSSSGLHFSTFSNSGSSKIHISYTNPPTSTSGVLGGRSSEYYRTPMSELIIYGNKVTQDLRYASMNAEALNLFFTNCGTAVASATLSITGNPGAATCNTSIATAKGFTVVN